MILQCLEAYYRRLADSGDESLVVPGYSKQNITFCVELQPDGSKPNIRDMRVESGKRHVAAKKQVLGDAKPPGQGINPCTLWDNTAYMLGFKQDDEKPERTRKQFEAFRDTHLANQAEINDPEFDAVCYFLKAWNPERANDFPELKDLSAGFGIFAVVGKLNFVHESERVKGWWQKKLSVVDDEVDEPPLVLQCLVSGQTAPIARLHNKPPIKGVNGGLPGGGMLVSFEMQSSSSYDRKQSYNSPVGVEAAFRYAVALNQLLERNVSQRVQIGDTTTVFWTEQQSPIESMIPGIFELGNVEDEVRKANLHSILDSISQGKFPSELGKRDTAFYVLGLSPNAARISVRFWWQGTIEEICDRIGKHFNDLAIVKPPKAPAYPSLYQILRETARESKDISPTLSGSMMRSILQGSDYPSSLLSSLLRRVKADRDYKVPPVRAAAIKACLNRTFRLNPKRSPLEMRLEMALNKERPEVAYQLGRLFAAFEKTQNDAFKTPLNSTIKDRYFSAASATPATVFPRLIRMNQHHIAKLEKVEYQRSAENRNREIFDRFNDFPNHLTMQEQGLFAIGYYQQTQDFYSKKQKEPVAEEMTS